MSHLMMAEILRNKEGANNIELGYGNEMALNQLLGHHAVIFKPSERKIWISSFPYQLGEFTAYDLNDIFDENRTTTYAPQYIDSLTISEDDFQYTQAFNNYESYRKLDRIIDKELSEKDNQFDSKLI